MIFGKFIYTKKIESDFCNGKFYTHNYYFHKNLTPYSLLSRPINFIKLDSQLDDKTSALPSFSNISAALYNNSTGILWSSISLNNWFFN